MGTAKITFFKCIQDSQDYGSDDEHMVSRVFFTLEMADKKHDLYTDIKQAVGSSYEKGPIEVSPPKGYKGLLNYKAFRDATEKYYRSLVGATGGGISIQGGTNIRMRKNEFNQEEVVVFEVDSISAGW